MKIKCDSCGAKYQIADEKVKHKVFKIRCKRCENVIVVHNDQGEDDPTMAVSAINEQVVEEDAEATKQVQHDHERARRDRERVESDEGGIWYLIVNRERVGPLTPEDVAGYLGRGEIDRDAFIWRDGMGDWSKLSAVADFAHLFSDVADPALGTEDNPFAAPQVNPFGGADAAAMNPHDPADDDVMTSDPGGFDGNDGLFAGVDAAQPAQPLENTAGGQLTDQRNENSVLFSLDDLENQNRKGGVTNTGGTEGSGLIDISLLGGQSAEPSAAPARDAGLGVGPVAVPRAMPSLVTRKRGNTGLVVGLIAAGVLVAGAVGAVIYFQMSKKDEKPATPVAKVKVSPDKPTTVTIGGGTKAKASPTPSADDTTAVAGGAGTTASGSGAPTKEAPTQAVAEPAAAPTGTTGQPTAVEKPAAVAKSTAVKKRKPKRSRSRRSARKTRPKATPAPAPVAAAPAPRPAVQPKPAAPTRPRKSSGKRDEVDDLLSGLGGGGSRPKARPSNSRPAARPKPTAARAEPTGNPLLSEKLSRRQVLSVVRKNARSIADCKNEQPDLTGTVMVDIVIAGSGRVDRARVASGKFAGTSVGRCVEARVRAFRFPRFSGSQMKLKIPFGIR